MRDAEPTDREAALQATIERLEDRIQQLEGALGLDFLTPVEWGLTGQMMRLFGCLMARELMTPAAAMTVLCDGRIADDEAPQPKIVDVHVCKMRKRLQPFGISIQTRWGQGHYLTPETKARVRDLMADVSAGAAA